jgi:hypothetical protein
MAALLSMLLTSASCQNAPSQAAICDGSSRLRTDHAAALAADGGNRSVVTGARLIAAIDAGCLQ